MERNFILGALVVCAVAFAAAASLKTDEARDAGASGSDLKMRQVERTVESAATATPAPAERQLSSGLAERRDDALVAHVEHKYRYLLADVESSHVEELKRRLLALEGEENSVRKATTDAQVSEMLSPREREYCAKGFGCRAAPCHRVCRRTWKHRAHRPKSGASAAGRQAPSEAALRNHAARRGARSRYAFDCRARVRSITGLRSAQRLPRRFSDGSFAVVDVGTVHAAAEL
jgi:hypothetical protein